ncbi:L-lactate dehydrogenase complex protein LldE [Desulfocicer vacuolatum DSM 3385]|uniref:L-lactate dehydrogenase complex protein LldE n=1 Tax=Desulfocicer vacuolatum DSM 3385 TaxID=1121400 RepID=A0A1W2EPX7_9BACT|nr:(Fe-S)-binding protein [Desulfocicer vacuolatum]SMD11764.1 L-lactate dehydrogenase complex protein LldE [Desulfocicer vacuolatum DSM 3385]
MVQDRSSVPRPTQVGLFVTCLVNLMRPSVGLAAIELLEQAGCVVEVPPGQSCCGQPGYNSGDIENSRKLARQVIAAFEAFDYVVVPSGSCAGMIAHHYPNSLFEGDPDWAQRARNLGAKTFELMSFLTDVMNFVPEQPLYDLSERHVTYHDSCCGLREMKVKEQPRQLLKKICNIDIDEMEETEECCGFGGSFSAKMPQISARLADNKIENAEATGADLLLGGDLGCLLHLSGRLRRQGKTLKVHHAAEILAGQINGPAIGEIVEEEQ